MLQAILGNMNEKNKRMTVAGAIGGGVLFLSWVGVIQPSFNKMKYIETQKKEFREKEPVFREVLATEARLAEYQKRMAQDRDLTPLMSKLTGLAEKAALQNVSTALEKSLGGPEGEIEKLSINIEATGSFHQLGDFVSMIENLEDFVRISRLDFARSQASTSMAVEQSAKPEMKRFTMAVSTYYVPKEAGA